MMLRVMKETVGAQNLYRGQGKFFLEKATLMLTLEGERAVRKHLCVGGTACGLNTA